MNRKEDMPSGGRRLVLSDNGGAGQAANANEATSETVRKPISMSAGHSDAAGPAATAIERTRIDAKPQQIRFHAVPDERLPLPEAWNDAHVGEAFAAHLGNGWLHVTLWKKWMRWDGRRWVEDTTEAVHEEARQWVIRLGYDLLAAPGDNSADLKKLFSYKGKNALGAIVVVARRILAVDPDVFDRHPHLLNAANGVIDLRTGVLSRHDPDLRLTKIAHTEYEPDATHRDINAVLGCVTGAVRSSLAQILGAASSGRSGGDLLVVLDGSGANGKTTLLLAASGALGDYAGPIPTPLLMATGRDEHPHIFETLRGLRLAFVEETEENGGLRVERVKALTGGAPITARPMGGSYYTFDPTHTLLMATNHRPIVNSTEHGIWRRLRLIPFPFTYSAGEMHRPADPGLRDRVQTGPGQRQAMLAWIVRGAIAAYRNGDGDLPVIRWCDEILHATAEWRAAGDVIGRFIIKRVEIHTGQEVAPQTKGSDVFNAYRSWCESEGLSADPPKIFHGKFQGHHAVGVDRRIMRQNAVWYHGIRVRPFTES